MTYVYGLLFDTDDGGDVFLQTSAAKNYKAVTAVTAIRNTCPAG
jgi:hypothetical protein